MKFWVYFDNGNRSNGKFIKYKNSGFDRCDFGGVQKRNGGREKIVRLQLSFGRFIGFRSCLDTDGNSVEESICHGRQPRPLDMADRSDSPSQVGKLRLLSPQTRKVSSVRILIHSEKFIGVVDRRVHIKKVKKKYRRTLRHGHRQQKRNWPDSTGGR